MSSETGSKAPTSSSAGNQVRSLGAPSTNAVLFLLAGLILIISSLIAFTQQPRSDPFAAPPQTLSANWWKYPLERNAFRRLPSITGELRDVFALPSGKHIWLVGNGGLIVHSADGGQSWEQQNLPLAQGKQVASIQGQYPNMIRSAYAMEAPTAEPANKKGEKQAPSETNLQQTKKAVDTSQKADETAAKAVDTPEKQQSSASASTQQTTETDPLRQGLQSVYFVDQQRGWAVGEGGAILATSNGGKDWLIQNSGTQYRLSAVQFLADGLRGWTVGDNGTILTTSNAGRDWLPQSSGTQNWLLSVQFLDDGQRGSAVGLNGTILTTNNAGNDWLPQISGTKQMLIAVQFLTDGQRGWAVGVNGTILTTNNAGKDWLPQSSGTQNWLSAVQFLDDGLRGWAVGRNGTILTTSNAGMNWLAQSSGTQIRLYAVQFLDDGLRGWAVGSDGTILTTSNAGKDWLAQSSGTQNWLSAVQFLDDGLRGWALSRNRTFLKTNNGGKDWLAQSSGTQNPLFAVQFLDNGLRGWVVGDKGTILTTNNAGKEWLPQSSGTQNDLLSVQFLDDGQRGWVVGRNGTILTTSNAGKDWLPQNSDTQNDLLSVQFLDDGLRGWAVGLFGNILATNNGGKEWLKQNGDTHDLLSAVQSLDDGQRSWAVGFNGTILTTNNAGKDWLAQNSGTQKDLYAVQFLDDGQRGWTMGDKGTVLRTHNAGKEWLVQSSGTQNPLFAVQFLADGLRGWAVGFNGTILTTNNGGALWFDPVLAYKTYPAPWFYLSWLPIVALLLWIFRGRRIIEASRASVADLMVSDRPLQAGEPDPLNFKPIAANLSAFLRNENTEPPLTIAISGEWGTGKSSMMNLLKADLEQRGFRPVWFNAWHHQKEEHMLASLLANIQKQGFPGWLSRGGINFRMRLLRLRGLRSWLAMLGVLLVLSFSSAYVIHNPIDWQTLLDGQKQQGLWQEISTLISGLLAKPDETGSHFLLLSSALFSLIKGRKWLTGMGLDPAMASAAIDGLKIRNIGAATGFRYQFKTEFEVVTEALKPWTMVIMIDDLDRCKPDNVLEVLEMINFLVSSGDCYVILGMAQDRVERCVGLGFKDVAEEMVDRDEDPDTDDQGKLRRTSFARQYLEKLINIEIPIPELDAVSSGSFFDSSQGLPGQNPWKLLVSELTGLLKRALPWLLVSATLCIGVWLGYGSPDLTEAPAPQMAQQAETKTQEVETTAIKNGTPVTLPDITPESAPQVIAKLEQANSEGWSRTSLWLAIAVLISAMLMNSLRRAEVVGRDSEDFNRALKAWHPLIISKRATPRALKRFLNRVRFFAMGKYKSREGFEAILVALSALHHVNKEWLNEEKLFNAKLDISKLDLPAATQQDQKNLDMQKQALAEALERHINEGFQWPPSDTDRELFKQLSAGVHVH